MSYPEQRKVPRIQPFVAPCHIVAGERRLAGYLADLGLDGARITCQEAPPPAGTAVIVEVKLGRSVARSRLAAEVKWVGSGDVPWHFGVIFSSVTEQEKLALQAVIDGFRQRAAQL